MTAEFRIFFAMTAVFAGVNALTFHEVLFVGNEALCEEGEFVESASAFCYLCASILTFFRGFHRKGGEQKLTWIFALTSLLFFVRELDLEDLNIPSLFITLGTGGGRDVFFVMLYLLLLGSLFLSAGNRAQLGIKKLLRSKVVLLVLAGGLFLIVGSLFERMHVDVVEELLEMNGAFLIFFAAILHEWIAISVPSKDL